MILVTGATGALGTATISHLLRRGTDPEEIAALVRDENKAGKLQSKGIALRTGDYTDPATLLPAFKGIDTLLLISSNDRGDVENRTSQHRNVIKAAKEAGVKHVVYTSFIRKPGYEQTAIAAFQNSHVQTEVFLKESGIAYTILQNGIYMEMIPVFAGKAAETGTLLYPAGEGRAGWVLRDELTEAAAFVLTTAGHENKTYVLANTGAASFGEIAGELSATLGKPVQYSSPAADVFEGILKEAGVPPLYIGMFTMWATAQAQGALDVEDDTLASFLGRKPATVRQFIQSVYGLAAAHP